MPKEPAVEAGWRNDPDDGSLMRWWDGATWGEKRKPRAVHIAEKQLRVTQKIAKDLDTIKQLVVLYFAASIAAAAFFYVTLKN